MCFTEISREYDSSTAEDRTIPVRQKPSFHIEPIIKINVEGANKHNEEDHQEGDVVGTAPDEIVVF